MTTILQRTEEEPARAELIHPETGETFELQLHRNGLAQTLRYMLYDTTTAAQLPLYVHRAAQGDFLPLAGIAQTWVSGGSSDGHFLAITCAEDVAFIREEDIPAASGLKPLRKGLLCRSGGAPTRASQRHASPNSVEHAARPAPQQGPADWLRQTAGFISLPPASSAPRLGALRASRLTASRARPRQPRRLPNHRPDQYTLTQTLIESATQPGVQPTVSGLGPPPTTAVRSRSVRCRSVSLFRVSLLALAGFISLLLF